MAGWGTVIKLMNTKALFIPRPEGRSQQSLFLHYRWKAGESWQRVEEVEEQEGDLLLTRPKERTGAGMHTGTQKPTSEGAGRNRSGQKGVGKIVTSHPILWHGKKKV